MSTSITVGRLTAVPEPITPGRKTNTWSVSPADNLAMNLCMIQWYGPWRKYVASMFGRTVIMDPSCLADLTELLKECMRQEGRHVKGE